MLQEPICVNLWHQGFVLTGPSHSEWRLKPQIPNSPKLQPWQLSATKAPAANKGWMEHVWHCRLIAMVPRWVKMLFWLLKQLLPREKVSEMVHFEVMGKAVFGWQGKLTGEKTRTDKELRADGCSNKEQTCSHVNKGFNCKHLQKKKKKKCFFKNVPLPSGAVPKWLQAGHGSCYSHTPPLAKLVFKRKISDKVLNWSDKECGNWNLPLLGAAKSHGAATGLCESYWFH